MGTSKKYQFPLTLTFFGLTSSYRKELFTQLHDLVFHGGGGFIHKEVYNMPTWLRRFHIEQINQFNKEQNEKIEKTQGKQPDNQSNKPLGPNISPSSTYNY